MDESPKKSRSRWLWWGVGGAVAGVILIGAAVWFFVGNKIWTDGTSIRVADRDARIRQVLWSKPRPLEGFSSEQQVYEPSISPDGTELYFVRGKAGTGAHIYVSHRRNNAWTTPAAVDAVNGPFDSLGPRVTADGMFLLFYSDRPGGLGGYDIWASPRNSSGWGKPFNLGPSVNSEYNEFNPDPTPDGKRLIFATNRAAARHEQNEAWRSTIRETVSTNYDLWMADADPTAARLPAPATQPDELPAATQPTGDRIAESAASSRPTTQPDDEPAAPPALAFRAAREVPGVNTEYTEGASCMSPAGDFLYFASNRPGGQGKFDIYRSRVRGESFGPVENVGPGINTAENEADPSLTYNGFRMLFSSDRPGADGRYHLLVADSREVYPERQGHPMPQLGLSWWLLIASALILIPLLMFLRGWEDHRLNLLQKCLLISLLVHAIITFVLSFVAVTQNVTRYVRREMGIEVAVNLKEAPAEEESLAIRGQVSNDLPTSGAAPVTLQPAAKTMSESAELPAPAEVNVPGARLAPGGMTIAAQSPKLMPPAARNEPVSVATAAAKAQALEVKLPSMQALRQPEAQPQAQSALAKAEKVSTSDNSQPAAVSIAGSAAPAASPSQRQLVDAAAAPGARPQVITAEAVKPAVGASVAGADVGVPGNTGVRVSANERGAAPAADAAATLARAVAQTGGSGPAPAQANSPAGVPKAAVAAGEGAAMPASPVHAQVAIGGSTAEPIVQVKGGGDGPRVNIASAGPRQAAAEPSVTSKSGANSATTGSAPLQASADRGSAGAGPGQLDVPAGPVATKPRAVDLTVAMNHLPGGVPGRTGPQVGLAPSPDTTPGGAAAGPQVALAATAIRQHQPEPAPAAGDAANSPTTRPVELASTSAAGGAAVPRIEVAAAPQSPTQSSSAVGSVALPARTRPGAGSVAANVAPKVDVAAPGLGKLSTAAAATGGTLKAVDSPIAPSELAAGPRVITTRQPQAPESGTASGPEVVGSGRVPAASINASSLAAAPSAAHRPDLAGATSAVGQDRPSPAVPGDLVAPQLTAPAMARAGQKIGPSGTSEKTVAADAVASVTAPARSSGDWTHPDGINIGSAPVQAAARIPRRGSAGDINSEDLTPRPQIASAELEPQINLAPLSGPIGPGHLTAPDSPFMRGPEERKPLLEKLGGTRQSEDAVDRGLAYLARVQEPDGRWTRVDDDRPPGHRPKNQHDMACTGFAVLAFLAHDHTPDKPGPYRDVVARAIDYLIAAQDDDGDLRGPREFRGGGSDSGNMYDQGIATYALAECAIMTHDPKAVAAATKGAQFIVKAQNRQTGGWRYSPNEPGDSSVFGWQIMALHSAEQIGFEIPDPTLEGAKRYLGSCEEGRGRLLGGYQPHSGPTQAMTAELLYCRMLLGMPLNEEGIHEATRFLAQSPPDANNCDLYYWYYASLSMLNMQNPLWKDWNILTRESLISLQQQDGPSKGCWERNIRWGERGGRVFTTAMATLTLEVYYRYLPLRPNIEGPERRDADEQAR